MRFLSLIALALTLSSPAAQGSEARATVTDGDSLVIGETRVRLHGIDAPELAQTCHDARGRDWACGTWARSQLSEITRGQTLRCTARDTDRYGRTIATCTAGGQDIAAQMVERGAAVAFTRYGAEYVAQERRARDAGLGLWAGRFDRPEDWRAASARPEVVVQLSADGCVIKGNISGSGRIYHLPGQQDYDQTVIRESQGERWFCTEAEARAAGWRRARR